MKPIAPPTRRRPAPHAVSPRAITESRRPRRSSTALLLLAVVTSLVGPANAAEPGQPADAPAEAPRTEPLFGSEKDKLSYALGVNAATQLRNRAVEVDPDRYAQGLKDTLSGQGPLLDPAEASSLVAAKQKELAEKRRIDKLRAEKEAAERNRVVGEAFLATNQTKEGVVTLPSGVQYEVLRAGDGRRPTLADSIVCHYRGLLVDGTEFNSTVKQGKPATLPLGKLMKGWREVVPLMPVGSKWRLVVPSTLAYGTRGAGRAVGPNATLVFELELLDIKERRTASAVAEAPPSAELEESASDPERSPIPEADSPAAETQAPATKATAARHDPEPSPHLDSREGAAD